MNQDLPLEVAGSGVNRERTSCLFFMHVLAYPQLHKSSDESSQNCGNITFFCPSSSHQLPLPPFQHPSSSPSPPSHADEFMLNVVMGIKCGGGGGMLG